MHSMHGAAKPAATDAAGDKKEDAAPSDEAPSDEAPAKDKKEGE
jgi:hypothetical protein